VWPVDSEQIPPAGPYDPEAAYRLGCRILSSRTPEDREHAERFFELAAAGSGPEILWRVARTYMDVFDGLAASWQHRAVAAQSDPDGIQVDPGTLPIVTEHGYPLHQIWEIAIRCDDQISAAAALAASVNRLFRITDDGRELSDVEWDASESDGVDFYSPNNVTVDQAVPRARLNCKDDIMPLMARAAIRIVLEELRAAGVQQATLFTSGGPEA